jgi:hypothetical protein
MTRSTLRLTAFLISLAACSAPPCPAGSVSVGERCIAADGGIEDGGAGDGGGQRDAGSPRDLGPLDASRDADAVDAEGPDDASVDLGDPDMCMSVTYYADTDDDGFGDPDAAFMTCEINPDGYAESNDDCDDMRRSVNPDAEDVCDGVDNDCDEVADEDFDCTRGARVACTTICGSAGHGTCSAGCTVPTTATCTEMPAEQCDGADQNCNGVIDDDAQRFVSKVTTALVANSTEVDIKALPSGGFVVASANWRGPLKIERYNANGVRTGAALTCGVDVDDMDIVASDASVVAVWSDSVGDIRACAINLSTWAVRGADNVLVRDNVDGTDTIVRAILSDSKVLVTWMNADGDIVGGDFSELAPISVGSPVTLANRVASTRTGWDLDLLETLVLAYTDRPSGAASDEVMFRTLNASSYAPSSAERGTTDANSDDIEELVLSRERLAAGGTGSLVANVLTSTAGELRTRSWRIDLTAAVGSRYVQAADTSTFHPAVTTRPSATFETGRRPGSLAVGGGRAMIAYLEGSYASSSLRRVLYGAATSTTDLFVDESNTALGVPDCLGVACTPPTAGHSRVAATFLSDTRAVIVLANASGFPTLYLWACPE